jgi:hypothetical protein
MHTKSIQLMMGIKLADGKNIIICIEIYQEPTRLTQVSCQQGKNSDLDLHSMHVAHYHSESTLPGLSRI